MFGFKPVNEYGAETEDTVVPACAPVPVPWMNPVGPYSTLNELLPVKLQERSAEESVTLLSAKL